MSKILPSGTMILRETVGECTNEETGNTYEMTTTMSRSPLIKSGKTGKTFVLTWDDIVNLAIDAGVDDDD